MRSRQKPTKISPFISSIFMMLTLAWLTVSLPFVYDVQQASEVSKSADTGGPAEDRQEETGNPFANTTEEKTSNNVISISEEYLHDTHSAEHYLTVPSIEYKVEHVSTYLAFHGELISPPPDAS